MRYFEKFWIELSQFESQLSHAEGCDINWVKFNAIKIDEINPICEVATCLDAIFEIYHTKQKTNLMR